MGFLGPGPGLGPVGVGKVYSLGWFSGNVSISGDFWYNFTSPSREPLPFTLQSVIFFRNIASFNRESLPTFTPQSIVFFRAWSRPLAEMAVFF
jgi:hypothetical protein